MKVSCSRSKRRTQQAGSTGGRACQSTDERGAIYAPWRSIDGYPGNRLKKRDPSQWGDLQLDVKEH